MKKVIHAYNISDHSGKLYLPEVMWSLFYSTVGKTDIKLDNSNTSKKLLKAVKSKYK